MDGEAGNGESKVPYNDLLSRALKYFALIGIFASIISFYTLLPRTIAQLNIIVSSNPYFYFLVNGASSVAGALLVLIVSAFAVTISCLTLFVKFGEKTTGTRIQNIPEFYRYFSVFILVELVLSLIAPQVSPSFANNPVLGLSLPVQNFIFISSSFSQTVIEQFIPIAIISVAYLAIRRKLSLKNLLNPDRSMERVMIPTIIIASVFASLVVSVDIGSGILNFFSFLILDFIYFRFGFTRALVSGFTISQYNILLQALPATPLPYVTYAFLIIWGMLGMFAVISVFSSRTRATAASAVERGEGVGTASDNEKPAPRRGPAAEYSKPENLWVRSACPSCGGYSFILAENMSLECQNCHHVIDRDAVGEFNVKLSNMNEVRS